VQFFLSQVYKAGVALQLNEAARAGYFPRQWRPQFLKLVRNLPALIVTHLRNVFDFRPQSFLTSQLWPVVWASEGLSGKAALARADGLAGAEPAAAAALAARQWGILLATALFTPCLTAFFAGKLADYVRIMMADPNGFAWFSIAYPMFLSLMLFRFFAPAYFFLYLSARRCHGETVAFTLPSGSGDRRSRPAAKVRRGTIAWLTLPTLLSLFVLYRQIPRDGSNRDLLDAVSDGRQTAALRSLDSGVTVNSSDRNGWTVLMHAIEVGNIAVARELVARHANVNARNGNGDTALLVALFEGHPDEAEMLIASGADVQIANNQGRTALMPAAMHGDFRLCKLLLERGANRLHRDHKGKTALDYAREEHHSDVVALLSAR
jgi:hypothetical protein